MKKIAVFGEVLLDIYEESNNECIGGAPFNFMFHLAKFGFDTDFISKIGNDNYGKMILKKVSDAGISKNHIQIDKKYDTGKVIIKLNDEKIPTYNIVENVAYDYIDMPDIKDYSSYNIIYFGTLAQRNIHSRKNLYALIEKSSNAMKFFDINLRQNFYNREIIEKSLNYTDILKLNEDELQIVCDLFEIKSKNDFTSNKNNEIIVNKEKVRKLSDLFNIKYITVTYGEKGSSLYFNNNCTDFNLTKKGDIVDTVGAGDAFSAMLVKGIIDNLDPYEILESSSEYALKICMQKGAV